MFISYNQLFENHTKTIGLTKKCWTTVVADPGNSKHWIIIELIKSVVTINLYIEQKKISDA